MVHSSERPSGDGDASRPSRHGPRLAQVLSALLGITALLAFVLFLFTGPWQLLVLYRDTTAVLAFDACLSAAFFAQHSGIQGVRVLEYYGTTTLGMRSIAQLHFRNDEMRLMGGVQVL